MNWYVGFKGPVTGEGRREKLLEVGVRDVNVVDIYGGSFYKYLLYFVYQSVLLNSTVLCEMSNIKHNRQSEQNATFLCLTTILVFITVYFIILGSFPDILKNVY